MSTEADMPDADEAALAELRELGLAAAREAQARLLTAEEPDQFAALCLAFNRLSRSVRQTIALQAKLRRDRERGLREAAAQAAHETQARVARRKALIEAAVERAIRAETEDEDEADALIESLDCLLSEQSLYDDFAEAPVAAHIARIRADLGLPPQDPPLLGEVSPKATEGASAESWPHILSGPPQSLRDSSPSGGASGWRSSA